MPRTIGPRRDPAGARRRRITPVGEAHPIPLGDEAIGAGRGDGVLKVAGLKAFGPKRQLRGRHILETQLLEDRTLACHRTLDTLIGDFATIDRKSVVMGKSVSVRLSLEARRILTKHTISCT